MDILSGLHMMKQATTAMAERPRLVALGMVPPFIVSLAYTIAAYLAIPGLVHWVSAGVTHQLSSWPAWVGAILSVVAVVVVLAAVIVVGAVAFTTITLAIGGPIYDRISQTIDEQVLGLTEVYEDGLGVAVMRSVSQSVVIFVLSLLVAITTMAVGYIPVIGPPTSLITGLGLGGWLVTTELLGGPFGRRGKPALQDRWQVMKTHTVPVLSFAVPAQFLLSIPVLGVLAFPFVSAGASVLAHHLLIDDGPTGLPTEP